MPIILVQYTFKKKCEFLPISNFIVCCIKKVCVKTTSTGKHSGTYFGYMDGELPLKGKHPTQILATMYMYMYMYGKCQCMPRALALMDKFIEYSVGGRVLMTYASYTYS